MNWSSFPAGDAKILAPVFFLPGMADGVIGLALGYGRTVAGHVGNDVGVQCIRPANDRQPRLAEREGRAHGQEATAWPRCRTITSSIITAKRPCRSGSPNCCTRSRWQRPTRASAKSPRCRSSTSTKFAGKSPASGDQSNVPRARSAQMGHGGRSDLLHRLRGLRRGLPGGEQHSHRRQGAGAARPRDALDPHRPLFPRHARGSGGRPPAGALHAVRERPLRVGLPCGRHHAQPGGPQYDDLQPLRGHALLLEQLSLQGAAVQFLRLQPRHAHRPLRAEPAPPADHRTDPDAEEPRRDACACGA